MSIIPESHRDLLEGPNHAVLVTLMPDNQPQASVVWCSMDGDDLLINTAKGRQKERNMQARPQATVIVVEPNDPDHRYIEVRGTVVEITEEGALELNDALAKAYRGVDSYYGYVAPVEKADKETRVVCRIRPTRVVIYGPH